MLQDATATYSGLMDKLVFNNQVHNVTRAALCWRWRLTLCSALRQSRKAEGDMARDKLATVEREHPMCSSGVKRLKDSGLGHWYRRFLAPKVPILLQEVP